MEQVEQVEKIIKNVLPKFNISEFKKSQYRTPNKRGLQDIYNITPTNQFHILKTVIIELIDRSINLSDREYMEEAITKAKKCIKDQKLS